MIRVLSILGVAALATACANHPASPQAAVASSWSMPASSGSLAAATGRCAAAHGVLRIAHVDAPNGVMEVSCQPAPQS